MHFTVWAFNFSQGVSWWMAEPDHSLHSALSCLCVYWPSMNRPSSSNCQISIPLELLYLRSLKSLHACLVLSGTGSWEWISPL